MNKESELLGSSSQQDNNDREGDNGSNKKDNRINKSVDKAAADISNDISSDKRCGYAANTYERSCKPKTKHAKYAAGLLCFHFHFLCIELWKFALVNVIKSANHKAYTYGYVKDNTYD